MAFPVKERPRGMVQVGPSSEQTRQASTSITRREDGNYYLSTHTVFEATL